ncbi:MAG: hypothetical protein V4568_17935 [Pseudomonadota bacterium]
MSSPAKPSSTQGTLHTTSMLPEQEQQMRRQLEARVEQRMRQPDIERRLQQLQKELLQEMQQQAQGHQRYSLLEKAKQILLEKVKRLYWKQQAQQGQINILRPIWDYVRREVKKDVEREAQFAALSF